MSALPCPYCPEILAKRIRARNKSKCARGRRWFKNYTMPAARRWSKAPGEGGGELLARDRVGERALRRLLGEKVADVQAPGVVLVGEADVAVGIPGRALDALAGSGGVVVAGAGREKEVPEEQPLAGGIRHVRGRAADANVVPVAHRVRYRGDRERPAVEVVEAHRQLDVVPGGLVARGVDVVVVAGTEGRAPGVRELEALPDIGLQDRGSSRGQVLVAAGGPGTEERAVGVADVQVPLERPVAIALRESL